MRRRRTRRRDHFRFASFHRSTDGRRRASPRWRALSVEPLEERTLLAVFTVTNTFDSGPGSFRQAIDDANAATEPASIEFHIPSSDPGFVDADSLLPGGDPDPDVFVIQPASALPEIDNWTAGITMDGHSQAVFGGNTNPFGPEIVLDGSLAGFATGLRIRSYDNQVLGVNIQQFAEGGVALFYANDNLIAGNYIGTDATGTTARGNQASGVHILAAVNNTIGGSTPETRNVISGNAGPGVKFTGGEGYAESNSVQGNFIGTDASGTQPLGNGGDGVEIEWGVVYNQIGGTTPGAENVIAFNGGNGVSFPDSQDSIGNAILSNSVFDNGGLGIDLGNDGPTPNDVGDGDIGPNCLQNFPDLTSAATCGSNLLITGTLNSRPYTSYRVEFFASASLDPSGYGEGETYLGSTDVFTYSTGDAVIDVIMPGAVSAGQFITATATDPNGNTSEFSQGIPVTQLACSLTVLNTNDDGYGSLRRAITCANLTAGLDTIDFAIPGAGPHTISPLSPLPEITDPVIIDATTQPGFAGTPIVELDGSSVDGFADGLVIRAGGSTVQGLVINRFSGNGITIDEADGNLIRGNYIGTDVTGTLEMPNRYDGVYIYDSSNNTIGGTQPGDGNLISGNGGYGVWIGTYEYEGNPVGNVVQGNLIGTDVTGTVALGNARGGVFFEGADDTTIGGATPEARNVISGNLGDAITLTGYEAICAGNVIQGNFIGTDVTGTFDLGNDGHGVLIEWASDTLIGGTTQGAGNTIAFNTGDGVSLDDDDESLRNRILGNSIFSNGELGIDLADDGVTANDPADGAFRPIPTFLALAAVRDGDYVNIDGTLQGAANSHFRIGFYFPNGGLMIAYIQVVTDANGLVDFSHSVYSPTRDFDHAEATDLDRLTGPNELQNYPVLASALLSGTDTLVEGILDSTPDTTFHVEFFSNSQPDPSGYGEGERFLGSADVTTDPSGIASFAHLLTAPVTEGEYITATATDPDGNTSEFSAAVVVTAEVPPAEIAIALQPTSDSGASDSDRITNVTTPVFDVTVDQAGLIEVDFDGNGTVDASQAVAGAGTFPFTSHPLGDGQYDVTGTLTPAAGDPVYDTVDVTIDTTPPEAIELLGIPPSPTDTPVESVGVLFSEVLDLPTFDHQDVALTRNGGVNLITPSVTVQHLSGTTYRMEGLTPLNTVGGEYELSVDAGGVADVAGNSGIGGVAQTWKITTAGVIVMPTVGLLTTEAGRTAEFSVKLNKAPTAEVVVPIASGDPTEGAVSVASLTFALGDWDVAQFVVVTGVADDILDGPVAYQVLVGPCTSSDPEYSGLEADDVSVINAESILHGLFPSEILDGGDRHRDTALAVGDLNGDQKLDVVAADFDDGTVSVLMNIGFGLFAEPMTFPVGRGPVFVALADLNNDQVLDIVTADSWDGTVSVLLGAVEENGTYTVQTADTYDAGLGPLCVSLGDLNNDGAVDIVTCNSWERDLQDPPGPAAVGYTVSVLLGNGDGTFQDRVTYDVRRPDDIPDNSDSLPPAYGPCSVSLGDLDGDGWLDVVTANYYNHTVSVLRNLGGAFGPAMTYHVIGRRSEGPGEPAEPAFPECVALGDLNGDEILDIVTANSQADTVSVLWGNPDGTFDDENQSIYDVGDRPMSVALGDLNGDGLLDIVTANVVEGSVSVLLGDGQGGFSGPVPYELGYSPWAVALGDLNGDQTLDVATANGGTSSAFNGSVSLLWGNGDGTLEGRATYDIGARPLSLALGYLDEDGALDAVTANFADATVSVRRGNGDGTFAHQETYDVGDSPAAVSLGDFNGDQQLDIVAANYADDTVSVLLALGGGTFADHATYDVGDGPKSVAAADLNGDGWLDIVTANELAGTISILPGHAGGGFGARQTYAVGSGPSCVAVGDLDGDGRPDVVTADFDDDAVSVLLNHAEGPFTARAAYAVGGGPKSVALGDLDGDESLDIVTANYDDHTVSVRLARGDGTFADQTACVVGDGPTSLALGDLDGDGWPDIVTANAQDRTVSVRWGDGLTAFLDKSTYAADGRPTSVAVGDLNGIGALDIVTANSGFPPGFEGTLSVFINRHLGPVASRQVSGMNLPEGDHWYRLQTTREAYLTLAATWSGPAAGVELALYDQHFNLLETSAPGASEPRIDYPAEAHAFYYFRVGVSGGGALVDLSVLNLVSYGGGTVTVAGSDGEDRFEFAPLGSFLVTINGVSYHFDGPDVASVTFDGGIGHDTALLVGTSGDDTAVLSPDQGQLISDGALVSVLGVESITIRTEGGIDTVRVYDSKGDDTLEAWPHSTTITGQGFSHEVDGFEVLLAYAKAGGGDTAVLHDSAGNDQFHGTPSLSWLGGDGFFNRVKFFDVVLAYAREGGDDAAVLYDSPGDDVLNARPELAWISGDEFFNRAKFFDSVTAYASSGADYAQLYDSAGNDVFTATPEEGRLHGDGFSLAARRFDAVHAYAQNGGTDVAYLYDSAGDDTLVAKPTHAKLTGPGFYRRANSFDYVHAYAKQDGHDVARFYDSARDDVFVGTPDISRLYGSDFFNRAKFFEEVLAAAGDGFDQAYLYDSPGNDAFTGQMTGGSLVGPACFIQADAFDSGRAVAADFADSDRADLYLGTVWEAVGDWEDIVSQPGPAGANAAEPGLGLAHWISALHDRETTKDDDAESKEAGLHSVDYLFQLFGTS